MGLSKKNRVCTRECKQKAIKRPEEKKQEFDSLSNRGISIYWSKNNSRASNLIGKALDVKGEKIVCRHLTDYVLKQGMKDFDLGNIAKIKAIPPLRNNAYDTSRIQQKATYYNCFPLTRFGQVLKRIAKQLKSHENRMFYLYSENHSMGINLHRESELDRFIIEFYDPTKTDAILCAQCANINSVGSLGIEDFLEPGLVRLYFPTFNMAVLHSVSLRQNNEIYHIDLIDEENNLAVILFNALRFEWPEVIQRIASYILQDSSKNEDEKIRLLSRQAKVMGGTEATGFYVALLSGNKNAISAYMGAILNSNLRPKNIITLLSAKNKGIPGFLGALQHGQLESVIVFLEVLLASNLESAVKVFLLRAQYDNHASGLYMAMQEGQAATVEAYVQKVLKSTLSNQEKKDLVAAKSSKFFGLTSAFINSYSVLQAYVSEIINSSLPCEAVNDLLAAKSSYGNGVPVLSMGLQFGSTAAVTFFVKAVLASSLDQSTKANLLAARRGDGIPGLVLALNSGRVEIVQAYIDVITQSTDLVDMQKKALLKAEYNDGTPGLVVDLNKENPNIILIRTYCQSVLKWGNPAAARQLLTEICQWLDDNKLGLSNYIRELIPSDYQDDSRHSESKQCPSGEDDATITIPCAKEATSLERVDHETSELKVSENSCGLFKAHRKRRLEEMVSTTFQCLIS